MGLIVVTTPNCFKVDFNDLVTLDSEIKGIWNKEKITFFLYELYIKVYVDNQPS